MEENSHFDRKSLKKILGKNAQWKELAKDCVCFANSKGGSIFIGIEDDGECPKGQKIKDALIDKINKTIPQLTVGVAINASKKINEKKDEYIELKVFRSSKVLASTTSGQYFARIADECKPVYGDQLPRLLAEKEAFNWELITYRNLGVVNTDFTKLKSFIKDIRSSSRVSPFIKEKSDEEILEYYFLSENGILTNLGVLWIGKRIDRAKMHYAPTIQFIKYDEKDNKIFKKVWDDYSLNPKELLMEVIQLSDWKESIEISDGLFRRNIPNYDIDVIRELVANALVHRVYTMRGDVFINLYHDKLEIHSPGLLPLGITPANIISKSESRNAHLAKIFYDLQLMEREGSGYDKVYEIQLFNGKKEPIVEEDDDRVIVTIEKEILSKEVVKLMSRIHEEFGLKQKEIIALGIIAQNNSIPSIELTDKLALRSNDVLKNWIGGLLHNNIIQSKGKTKATEYFVNPSLLKQIDFKGKTNLKRIEKHRLKELIHEDLKIYQPCSLSDIHDRIGKEISRNRIKRTMDDLIEENEVTPIGEKRWRKYQLTSFD